MSTAPKLAAAAESAADKKQIKKLTIDIENPELVLQQYPTTELIITKRTVDRKKLRPIVKALYDAGIQVPGVKAFYASEAEPETPPVAESFPHQPNNRKALP